MGRKQWWAGGLGLLVLCILHHGVLADGDVGECDRENVTKYYPATTMR